MAGKMQAIMNKQIRGHILKVLELTYPTPTPCSSVISALLDGGLITTPDIAQHVDYLEDRGYIARREIPAAYGGAQLEYLKLTSKGVDLLEETVTDAGVDL